MQMTMFGIRIEEVRPAAEKEIIPLDFESHPVRMLMIGGRPWWVLADIARVLGYRRMSDAARHLRDKEKGTAKCRTLGGEQEVVIVNQSGIYRLMMRSDRPEAERFQDWITEEVLPALFRTGTYTLGSARTKKTQKKLSCDIETAKIRCEQTDINKSSHTRLASDKACPNNFKAWHNGGYRGQTGKEAKEIRLELGIGSNETPLDHMDLVPLSTNTHSKVIADRLIREAAKAGRPIPIEEQAKLLEQVTRDMTAHDLARFGPGAYFGVVEDPRRGKIYDVKRPQVALN